MIERVVIALLFLNAGYQGARFKYEKINDKLKNEIYYLKQQIKKINNK